MARKAKKVEKKTNTKSTLDIAKEAVKKKYGGVIGTLSDYKGIKIPTISSGSISLDVALGRGGFARGRVYEIFGPPSGGKTTLAMSVIAQAQKKGLSCVFVDAEHSVDPELFEAMGVDLDKLIVITLYTGDENLDALEMLVKSGGVDVAVVDSVASLIPKAEAEADMSDHFMGLHARLMSKALRKLVPILSETNTLLLFINQVRYKIGGWGDPTKTTGGEALAFYSTGRIAVTGGEFKNTWIKDKVTSECIGHNTSFYVKKNKLAPPHRQAEVPLIYGVGYDSHWECLKLAESLGIIDVHGAWRKYNGENIAQGEENCKAFLRENEKVYNEVREKIIEMTGLKKLYEQNS